MADDQQLPAPLTPPDCDLQSFPYMELDVGRLRQSKFSATPNAEAFRAGFLLWCASWHQIPAASLPDDDIELADLAGYGKRPFSVKFWRKVRQEALNGFVKCSDGRLYHAVVAEKARAAWSSRLEYFYEKLKDRVRKENKIREKDGLQAITVPPFDDWISAGRPDRIPAENGLKGNGEGEGKGKGEGLGSAPDGAGAASPPPRPTPAPAQASITLPAAASPTPTPAPAGTDFDRRKSATWKAAKSFLGEKGVAKAQAGTFLGALYRDHAVLGEEAFLVVLEDMVKVRPAEPQPWLTAAFQQRSGARGNRQDQLEDRNRHVGGDDWLQGGHP